MYTIDNTINTTAYDGFQAQKLVDMYSKEILTINLEAKAVFPKHTSPRDAHLLMLEGSVLFYIEDKAYALSKHQVFEFPKDVEHWVEAQENSKFLIIR